jgi:hypothetical protein
MAGKNARLVQGMLRRRLRSMVPNATADEREEIIHRKIMERVVDERARIEGAMWAKVEANEMPKNGTKVVLRAWGRRVLMRV